MKVGVVMPLGMESGGAARPYAELRELARTTEASGLDSIWVFDHLLYRFPGEPQLGTYESWTILSALAADTSRVQLGSLVLAMAFRNPALLAKMAATLQEVSDGRLVLGVGAGWHEPEFEAFGFPYEHRVPRFEEAIRILAPLLRDGSVDFEGRYHAARDAVLLPPSPVRTPLLIAARRPRMMRLVATYADAFNCAWLGPVSGLEERIAPLRVACNQVGRDFASIELTVGVNVVFDALLDDGDRPRIALAGAAGEVAAGLRDYADAGVGHVITSLSPATPAAVNELSHAVALSRA
jgi:alkanesulfonate monooxygenase SsuD/methylene tetrahydromethanopterin reductase-like flavin-dependent oxidoreductase (luciferase family)